MYQKRGSCSSFEEYVVERTGKTIQTLDAYKDAYVINKLSDVADRILRARENNEKIVVYADYDADGITSAAQFGLLFRYLGMSNVKIIVPRRFSDGYGLSVNSVKLHLQGEKGLLITVDNGIGAINAISEARSIGWDVIIMDHHKASLDDNDNIIIPNADIVVDPEALPQGCDFDGYCGAGLTNKLMQMIVSDPEIMKKATAFAAIGTVCDVVPMIEDNRQLVKNGIVSMNTGHTTAGLKKLIEIFGLCGHVNSKDIGFSIGPCFNASTRLYDVGGMGVFNTILLEDELQASVYARRLVDINDLRKKAVKDAMENVRINAYDNVNFIKVDAGGGLLGLIASSVIEKRKRPTFVFTENNGICSGSARTDMDSNNVKEMLDSIRDLLIKYGGHPGAAGFTFSPDKEDEIRKRLNKYPIKEHIDKKEYDLVLNAEEATSVLCMMDQAEPFGKGLERPTFKIECNFQNIEYWHSMGRDGSHLRFDLPGGLKGVAFGAKEQYMQDGCPKRVNLYGDLNWNWWKGEKSPNFIIDEIEVIKK